MLCMSFWFVFFWYGYEHVLVLVQTSKLPISIDPSLCMKHRALSFVHSHSCRVVSAVCQFQHVIIHCSSRSARDQSYFRWWPLAIPRWATRNHSLLSCLSRVHLSALEPCFVSCTTGMVSHDRAHLKSQGQGGATCQGHPMRTPRPVALLAD